METELSSSAENRVRVAAGHRKPSMTPRYRLDVAGRAVAAIAGGYVVASAIGTAAAAMLFQTGVQARGPAVSAGTSLTFLVWAAAAMWAFSTRRHWMVWIGLLVPAIIGVAVAATIGFEA